jgi:hypothetical protein
MKIKYYSIEDYRKAECNVVKAFNKAHKGAYKSYETLYSRNQNKKLPYLRNKNIT